MDKTVAVMTTPTPTQIYRHRQHNPAAGHWLEYEVVSIVEPWPADPGKKRDRTHWVFPNQYRHTTTGELMTLTGCARWVYANVDELHVAYKSTRPDLCAPEWAFCLQPLREFGDRGFTYVPAE